MDTSKVLELASKVESSAWKLRDALKKTINAMDGVQIFNFCHEIPGQLLPTEVWEAYEILKADLTEFKQVTE